MVGSMDYYNTDIDGQVNVALSERQPGSTIKPIVYMTAFTRGWLPSTVIEDEKISIKDELGRVWEPAELRQAFPRQRTAAHRARQLAEHPGRQDAPVRRDRRGLRTWPARWASRPGPSNAARPGLALGGAEVRPLDMAGRLHHAREQRPAHPAGRDHQDRRCRRQHDRGLQGAAGRADRRPALRLHDHQHPDRQQRPTDHLRPEQHAEDDRPAAAKTGTTDNYRDTWTMGYTPNLVVGVWVGNTDGHPMKEVLSSMSAGKIWRESMDTAWPT